MNDRYFEAIKRVIDTKSFLFNVRNVPVEMKKFIANLNGNRLSVRHSPLMLVHDQCYLTPMDRHDMFGLEDGYVSIKGEVVRGFYGKAMPTINSIGKRNAALYKKIQSIGELREDYVVDIIRVCSGGMWELMCNTDWCHIHEHTTMLETPIEVIRTNDEIAGNIANVLRINRAYRGTH